MKSVLLVGIAAGAILMACATFGERSDNLYVSHVHRGGGKFERPDNTLETFRWCWENGFSTDYPSVMFKVIKTLKEGGKSEGCRIAGREM